MNPNTYSITGEIVTIVDNETDKGYAFSTISNMLMVYDYKSGDDSNYVLDGIEALSLFAKFVDSCEKSNGRLMILRELGIKKPLNVGSQPIITYRAINSCYALNTETGDCLNYSEFPTTLTVLTTGDAPVQVFGVDATERWLSLAALAGNDKAREELLSVVRDRSLVDSLMAEIEQPIVETVADDVNSIFF